MENRLIDANKIRLARVRYYDVKNNGAELSSQEAYAFLLQVDEKKYINPFDVTEDLPVLDRTFYANVMPNGEEYGTKLFHVCGELVDGPCYVLERQSAKDLFKKENISLHEIKRYILYSNKFFVDRRRIISELEESFFKKSRFLPTIMSDSANMEKLKKFFAEHESGKQYIK